MFAYMEPTQGVSAVAELPPGPALAAALAGLDFSRVPNDEMVDVLRAQARQSAHDQARLFAALHQTARCVVGAPGSAARVSSVQDWAVGEITAALSWTPSVAERELGLAERLIEHLPRVFAALSAGEIDRAKAWVFAHHLDPAWLTSEQIEILCTRYVPLASAWTTRQLAARLQRAVLAIDPDHARRRYQQAVRERAVHHWLDPSGTVTITGSGLSIDEAAAACARLDRLAATIRRAGHPAGLPQIRADLYLGMLNGHYTGMTETEIITHLLDNARARADSEIDEETPTRPDTESGDERTHRPGPFDQAEPGEQPEPTERSEPGEQPEPTQRAEPDDQPQPAVRTSHLDHPESAAARSTAGPPGQRPVREGVELRVGLATLLGLDDRPGEIPDLGPVLPDVARRIVTSQKRGAQWRFAVVDDDGYLLLAGLTRRRPTGPVSGCCRGGIVELHLTADRLRTLAAQSDRHPTWAGVIADLAEQYARREQTLTALDDRPDDRFAHAALARHVQIRDRTCTHIGCTRPARTCDLDHAHDHALGGRTTQTELNPECDRHHLYKHELGWRLHQPRPGVFRWTSPLGRSYRTRGEPIMPPLPRPSPRERPPPHTPDDQPF